IMTMRGRRMTDVRSTTPARAFPLEAARVLLIDEHSERAATISTRLAEQGTEVSRHDDAKSDTSMPRLLAASGATHRFEPFSSAAARRNGRHADLRAARLYLTAAAVLLLVTAFVATIAARHELVEIRRIRAAHATHVAAAESSIARLDSLRARYDELRAIRERAPRWTTEVVDIAVHLPVNSYLTALTGRSDTLTVAGLTRDAEATLNGLRQAQRLNGARYSMPLQAVEMQDGAWHRFSLQIALTEKVRP
ncbi:MAG: hypothetical protein ACREK1_12415, partial [Longimicrobiales bacterium]